eukprot:12357527-Alexandrium_andersonii.AAC.1
MRKVPEAAAVSRTQMGTCVYQDDVVLDVEAARLAGVWATLKSQLAQDGWEVQPAKCCGHVPSGAP